MYFNHPVHYMYFDAQPYQLYMFLWCVIKSTRQCIYVYQHTTDKGNKFCGMPCKFIGCTPGDVS